MNSRLTKYLFSFYLFFFIQITNAQDTKPAENTREACQKLMDEAWEDANNKNYASSFKKLLEAEQVAEEHQWTDKLWLIKNLIGQLYNFNSDFSQAFEYFEQSYMLTQELDSLKNKGSIPLTNIGVLLAKEKKYGEAVQYYEKAYELAKKGTDGTLKAIGVNLASIYNYLGNTQKSLAILEEVKSTGRGSYDLLWEIAHTEALFYNLEVKKAQQRAEILFENFKKGKYKDFRGECQTCMYKLLASIYDTPETRKKAIYYTKEVLKNSDDLTDKLKMYKTLVRLYEKGEEYNVASGYKDSVIQTTDSLAKLTNRAQYEINKVKFKTQEYQNELKLEKERKQKQQFIFIIIIVFLLIISLFTYKTLRNKVIKQNQRTIITDLTLEKEKKGRLLAEKQLEIVKNQALLKQEQLKNDIARKNRELTTKTLYQTKRNKLIKDIIESLEGNNKIIPDKETTRQIRTISKFLKSDDKQDDFIRHFEEVNPLFLKNLKEKHSQLTANDVRFLCYVYMNLSLKEISSIFNITYNACRKRKRRIMDKMGIDKEEDSLYEYILNI